MGRFNVSMPDELWERIGLFAPAGNRSYFIRRAVEAALEGTDVVAAAAARRTAALEEASGSQVSGVATRGGSSPRPAPPREPYSAGQSLEELKAAGLVRPAVSIAKRGVAPIPKKGEGQ